MVFPVLPILLLVLGSVSLPFLPGCRQVREIKEEILHPSCTDIPVPDTYRSVDPASWRVMHTLWLRDAGGAPAPWLSSWLAHQEPNAARSHFLLGAAEILSRPICERKKFFPSDEENITAYRAGMQRFFEGYFTQRFDPLDDGALVLLAGLAPADAGESMVIAALNGFNDPTERPSPGREQMTQFTQLLKAACYFNAAADRAGPSERFRMKRQKGKIKAADRISVRAGLDDMKKILDPIKVDALSDRQRELYDVLKEAEKNLRAGV